MKALLKIMLSDVTPKSFKSFFEGIAAFAIVIIAIIAVAIVFVGIAGSIAWLFALPIDLAILILNGIVFLGIWVSSAYERMK